MLVHLRNKQKFVQTWKQINLFAKIHLTHDKVMDARCMCSFNRYKFLHSTFCDITKLPLDYFVNFYGFLLNYPWCVELKLLFHSDKTDHWWMIIVLHRIMMFFAWKMASVYPFLISNYWQTIHHLRFFAGWIHSHSANERTKTHNESETENKPLLNSPILTTDLVDKWKIQKNVSVWREIFIAN